MDVRTDDFLRAKFSWKHTLPYFLTYGAPLRASRARELRYKDRRNANSIFKRRSRCRPRCWVLKSLMFPVLTRQFQTVKLSFPIVMRFSLLGPMSASFRLNATHNLMIQQNLDITKCQWTGEICSISRVSYIEHLDFKDLRKNNQNVCYIEVKLIINFQNPALPD